MEIIHQASSGPSAGIPVYLICVIRDEELLLPYFIEYYRELGVTHFIFIDNGSIDGGPAFLANLRGINLTLYRCEDSYRDANFGTDWVNEALAKHCSNQFCFTVDVDELFRFDTGRYSSLSALLQDMAQSGANVVPATLLDMYPAELNDQYRAGQGFLEHCPYFDAPNPDYYEQHGEIYETWAHRVGGVRKRIFGKRVCIHKFPLIRYDFAPIVTAAGYHYFRVDRKTIKRSNKIKLLSHPAVLLHFKFIKPQFTDYVSRRIRQDQDWSDSAEYRAYAEKLAKQPKLSFMHGKYSTRLSTNSSLTQFFCFGFANTNKQEISWQAPTTRSKR